MYVYRHRRHLKSLDSVLTLTRGAPLSWSNLISSIRPVEHFYTGVVEPEDGSGNLVGQVHLTPTIPSAHLNYLLIPDGDQDRNLVILLESLIREAGEWGAKQVISELDLGSVWFSGFRRAGFSVLAKQRIYRFTNNEVELAEMENHWRTWNHLDISAIRSLYQTLVPNLMQPVEPMTRREMLGLVLYDSSGKLQAYADLVYGPVGIWVLPFVHPQSKDSPTVIIQQLLQDLPDLNGRPVYLVVRSYQPWLDPVFENFPAAPGPEQVLLVRHLALQQRANVGVALNPLESSSPEPTIPIARAKVNRE